MTGEPPELTIVIAAPEGSPVLADALRSFAAQTVGRRAQIVVAAAPGATGDGDSPTGVPVETVTGAPGMLVPHLWGLGIERARGELVALTIDHCLPLSGWAETLFRTAHDHPEVAGFGGPIAPPVGSSPRHWAAYFVRYSGYLGLPAGERDEIPGDNAVYRLTDLERGWTDRRDGFWETLFHRALRECGGRFLFEPRFQVRLAATEGASRFARRRLRHGRHFASTRDLSTPLLRPVAALAAPLLTPLLLHRIWRRVARSRPEWRPHLRRSLPWLLLYLGAWSLGEATGYLRPGRRA